MTYDIYTASPEETENFGKQIAEELAGDAAVVVHGIPYNHVPRPVQLLQMRLELVEFQLNLVLEVWYRA